jgi:hypothetical protein
MFNEEISTKKFKSIMKRLYQKDVWIKIIQEECSVKWIDLFYENFEFCELKGNKYQFGNEEPDSPHLPFHINSEDIAYIERDIFAPTCDGEQIIIYMNDDTKIFVDHNV